MTDDVKEALEELEQTFATVHRVATHQTDDAYMSIPADPKRDADLRHMAAVETLRAHIDGEPARLAAAVAREREEQRETDARAIEPSYSEACTRETDERWSKDREESFRERERAAEIIRATPLTATPLADELERAWNTTAKHVDERDAALLRVKELEGLIKDGMRVANALTLETQTPEEMAADLVRQVRDARTRAEAAEAERDALKARVKELKTALHLEREAHGRALREALDPVVRAKMMEPPPPLLLSPDVASLMSERDALKTQLAEAVAVLKSFADAVQMFDVDFVDAEAEEAAGEALSQARNFLAKVKL